MSTAPNTKEEDEIPTLERPPSPPLHTTFTARGFHIPTFSAFRPRDFRMPSPVAMTHVAWSCDGKKLAAVGIDKVARVFQPEKSMEMRSAATFAGGHSDDVDYVTWNPTHPELFCTSSQKDRRVVFWDARRNDQFRPVEFQTSYSPDGRVLLYVSSGHQVFSMTYGKEGDDPKQQWHIHDKDVVMGSTAMFNYAGDAIILTHHSEHTIRIVDYPTLTTRESPAAHVGGCVAVALDPRGRYLASGGHDSIVNLFDVSEWICCRTITACDNAINSLSFSHDGEFIAIANTGSYIDICATETGTPLSRVPAVSPSPVVTWHPSKYAIAYCGASKYREGMSPAAVVSLFGPGI